MAGKKTEDIVRCSFCNKTQSQVRKMIAGPNGTYICDDCVGCGQLPASGCRPGGSCGTDRSEPRPGSARSPWQARP